MSEHDEQSTFFRILELSYSAHPELEWLHAIPNASGIGGKGGVTIGAKFKREGRKPGVWDTFFPYPANNYHGLYIEFKAPGKELSMSQTMFGYHLLHHQYQFGVAFSAEGGIEILEKYTGWKLNK